MSCFKEHFVGITFLGFEQNPCKSAHAKQAQVCFVNDLCLTYDCVDTFRINVLRLSNITKTCDVKEMEAQQNVS